MTRSTYTIILLFVLFNSNSLYAQKNGAPKIGVLSGTIIDSIVKTPLEYVSVKLFSVKDSSFVTGIYSDSKGVFLLDQIPAGRYNVKISLLGYSMKMISNVSFNMEKTDRALGTIRLSADKVQSVDDVKVIANKKILETSFDKKVYNVADDISSKGGTVKDVLNNVPSVEVDQDGSISLRGSGNVTILIDGKPSTLSGSGGSMLDGIPSSLVDRIELVTNPSSKYDPDGTSGIINIVLKKKN